MTAVDDAAEQHLAAGDPSGALAALQERVRARPADAPARVFLFQLLCVLGQWSRAGNQLEVAAELDSRNLLMARTCRELLRCEALREAVFDGRRAPMVLGEPPPWIASLVQALPLAAAGDGAAAARLADDAFERAAPRAGRLGGTSSDEESPEGVVVPGVGAAGIAFDWIGDADMRLGPVLEAMFDGKYCWVPFERLAGLVLEPPSDLRDLVWTPAEFQWDGGGRSVGFVPTRYPRVARADEAVSPVDPACLMARRSDWTDLGGDYFTGRGQRVFASSAGDHALLDCRTLQFGTPDDRGADA